MAEDRYFPAVRRLAEYEVWCSTRAIEAAAGLSGEQLFQQFPFGLKTIHATLFHMVDVFGWWGGCVGPMISQPPEVPYDVAMPLEQIAQWNARLGTTFLSAIDASHAAGLLHLDRRIEQVLHLVTHGTHHRTQFITMLRLLGKDPPFEAGDFGGWSRPL
jgi:uncharacterized damage-inducible protein DinB